MRKLDLILENIRDEYMINVLEEGTITELETLKTKKFLNENLQRVRTMLVEEGTLDGVKDHLANNWGKYLAGAGAVGAGVLGQDEIADQIAKGQEVTGAYTGEYPIANATGAVAGGVANLAGQAGEAISNVAGQAADAAREVPGQVQQAYQQAMGTYVPDGAVDPMSFAGQPQAPAEVRDPAEVLAAANVSAGMESPRVDPSRYASQA